MEKVKRKRSRARHAARIIRGLDSDGRTAAPARLIVRDPHHSQLRAEMEQLHVAARQLASAATSDEELEKAAAIVRAARQALYRLLADQ